MGKLAIRQVEVKRVGAWGHKCGYQRPNGTWCGNWAIRGGYCCTRHGGQLPVVRASAKARLRSLTAPAIDVLMHTLQDEGVPANVRLRAVMLVLRLNGIKDTLPERQRGRLSAAQRALESGARRVALESGDELDDEIDVLLAQVTGNSGE